MSNDENRTEPRRLDQLAERAADDVAALAHQYTGVAKREVAAAGARAMWPAATAAVGAVVAVVGAGLLFASPAVPSSNRLLRRRMRAFAVGYLLVGGLGCGIGLIGLGDTLTRALPRTRRGLHAILDAVRRVTASAS